MTGKWDAEVISSNALPNGIVSNTGSGKGEPAVVMRYSALYGTFEPERKKTDPSIALGSL